MIIVSLNSYQYPRVAQAFLFGSFAKPKFSLQEREKSLRYYSGATEHQPFISPSISPSISSISSIGPGTSWNHEKFYAFFYASFHQVIWSTENAFHPSGPSISPRRDTDDDGWAGRAALLNTFVRRLTGKLEPNGWGTMSNCGFIMGKVPHIYVYIYVYITYIDI